MKRFKEIKDEKKRGEEIERECVCVSERERERERTEGKTREGRRVNQCLGVANQIKLTEVKNKTNYLISHQKIE